MFKTAGAVVFLLAIFLIGGAASAQDADEVTKLKREIELLKKENDLLTRENALLKKENEELKAAAKRPAPKAGDKGAASKLFVKDSVWSVGEKGKGIRLVVKERTGDVFQGVITFGDQSFKCRGEVSGDKATLTTLRQDGTKFYRKFEGKVDGAVWEVSVSGTKADGKSIGQESNKLTLSER